MKQAGGTEGMMGQGTTQDLRYVAVFLERNKWDILMQIIWGTYRGRLLHCVDVTSSGLSLWPVKLSGSSRRGRSINLEAKEAGGEERAAIEI